MTHDTESERGLPELPQATRAGFYDSTMRYTESDYYSAYAMRAYAIAAIEKDRAERSEAVPVAALSSRPAVQQEGWRPIETAPKDGYFLAFKPGVAHIVAVILDADHPDCEYDGGVHEAWSLQFVDGITHWMPLPADPNLSPADTRPADVSQKEGNVDTSAEAIRREALEEAARLCEWRAHAIDGGGNAYLRSRDALDCALAIRAMSTPGERNG